MWHCAAGMYEDMPSCMTKVLVKDRSLVRTTVDETAVTEPSGLQPIILDLVSTVENGRSFVRPSGTEDCVRVYAEGASQALADKLADDVGKQVALLLS